MIVIISILGPNKEYKAVEIGFSKEIFLFIRKKSQEEKRRNRKYLLTKERPHFYRNRPRGTRAVFPVYFVFVFVFKKKRLGRLSEIVYESQKDDFKNRPR